MNTPKELLYVKSHEWVKFSDEATAKIGITDFAQNALGDLVFVNLPEVGDTVEIGVSFGDVESVKAVSDIFSPVTGKVIAVNGELLDSPEAINANPYEAWFIEVGDITDKEEFLDAEGYDKVCAEEEG